MISGDVGLKHHKRLPIVPHISPSKITEKVLIRLSGSFYDLPKPIDTYKRLITSKKSPF